MTEEQKARLQEARDDAERAWRREDDEHERRILRTKAETLEAVAYIFGVDLEPFEMFPIPRPTSKCTCSPGVSHAKGCPYWVEPF